MPCDTTVTFQKIERRFNRKFVYKDILHSMVYTVKHKNNATTNKSKMIVPDLKDFLGKPWDFEKC